MMPVKNRDVGNAELLEKLIEIEAHLSSLVRAQIGAVMERELDDQKLSALYKMTGEASRQQIQKKLKMGPNKISDFWNRWQRLGLLARDGNKFKKVI